MLMWKGETFSGSRPSIKNCRVLMTVGKGVLAATGDESGSYIQINKTRLSRLHLYIFVLTHEDILYNYDNRRKRSY